METTVSTGNGQTGDARRPAYASLAEALAFLTDVVAPTWGKGILIRRRTMVGIAAALHLDRRAIRRLQRFRQRRHGQPLIVRTPVRNQVVVLNASDARQVLEATPCPFTPASSEKRAALSHFEPRNVLISSGEDRQVRRRFQETALDTAAAVHCAWPDLAPAVALSVDDLSERILADGGLSWSRFSQAWLAMSQRLVLGESGAEDLELADMLTQLRRRANWAFMAPKDRALRARFLQRVTDHLRRAEPGSLAHWISLLSVEPPTAPADQVAQWLFAFDPAGIGSFRTLAVIATHPEVENRVREELASPPPDGLPYLRACVVETLRLWPTTPAILRQATAPAEVGGQLLRPRTGVLIFTPFLHRTPTAPAADRFAPEVWLGRDPADHPDFVPFSAGPAACPARQFVPLVASALIGGLLRRWRLDLTHSPGLAPSAPLPATLNHFTLRFAGSPAAPEGREGSTP